MKIAAAWWDLWTYIKVQLQLNDKQNKHFDAWSYDYWGVDSAYSNTKSALGNTNHVFQNTQNVTAYTYRSGPNHAEPNRAGPAVQTMLTWFGPAHFSLVLWLFK